MLKTFYTLALALVSVGARAQTDSTDTGKLTVSGYIDSYYLTAFNRPQSGNLLGVDQLAGRAFDRLTDQFALGLVQAKLSYSNRKSDLVVDLTFGPNAELGNFGNTTGAFNLYRPASPYLSSLYGTSAAIKQAYFTYRILPKLSVTIGQFGTHIGYEVIDAPLNYNYSLSNLFNNGPFYHIGLKAAYAFSDKTSLMVGVVNNWDNLTDDNKQKSLIAQLSLKPLPTWAVYLNWVGGHGDDTYLSGLVKAGTLPFSFDDYQRNLFDLTTTYQVTPKFYLGLNAAYGWYHFGTSSDQQAAAVSALFRSTSPDWGGVALYSNYAFTDVLGVGVRLEHFNDNNGVRYLHTTSNTLTITTPVTLAAGKLQVKPELRFDATPGNYYENSNGAGTDRQTTLGVAFIYKY
ncbi:outer membrane beta-barrel protein [Hymenobacter nivis]|uniref:Porin n=1 Tax=Hymenobacter nivis TaxID=1850093 RepID=A0A502GXP4_9BACT|nr:outer membrane beta-barrel protein [Hymenobacter nivis]TPG65786.1 porin [Hymenobacter nivis]